MLPFENRLKNSVDFEKAYRQGKSFFCNNLVIQIRENGLSCTRIGISVGVKNFKRAVVRNRLKRQIRAFFRENLLKIRQGGDIVVILKKGWDKEKNPAETLLEVLIKSGWYV